MNFKNLLRLALLITLSTTFSLQAQVHNDGPMIVKARLRQFNIGFPETDLAAFGATSAPDDMTYRIWGRDLPDVDLVTLGGGWGVGSGCLMENYGTSVTPTDFDSVFFEQYYPTAQTPHAIELRADFWEDESPDQYNGVGCSPNSRCTFETGFCCGGILFGTCMGVIDSDDFPCNSGTNPYATLDFRLGPPGQWYSHGNVGGACANNVYFPTIETYWRNANGEDCSSPIDLGTLSPGFSAISHTNAVDGYNDDVAYTGGGIDVVYSFTLTQSMWINFTTCNTGGTCPTDLVLVNSTCGTMLGTVGTSCSNGYFLSQEYCTAGTYYVAVEARNNTPTGSFTLTVSESTTDLLHIGHGPAVPACPGVPIVIGPGGPPWGGTIPYTYLWSPSTGLDYTIFYNATATVGSSQQYIFTVYDDMGCTATDTVEVIMAGGAPFSLGPDTTVCPGGPLTLSGPLGGSSYLWSTADTTQSLSTAIPGVYSLTVTSGGCQATDTVVLGLGAASSPGLRTDTVICPDTSVVLFSNPGMSTYLWSTGDVTSAITASVAAAYSVTVTDAAGCTAADTMVLSVIPDCVFPGDVDHDGDCDLTDVLHLSALNGTTGFTRPAAVIAWYGQTAADWSGSFSGVNDKHADTDGNSFVNDDDTMAIHQNFGRIHSRVGTVTSGPAVLRMVPQASVVAAGDWVHFDVYLEASGGGVIDSVLGLAFESHWDPTGMAANALRSANFGGCWFAPWGSQFGFTEVMPQAVGFVVARDNGTMVSGNGLVGTLSFLTDAALPSGLPFFFSPTLLDVEVIAADHSLRTGTVEMDSVLVTDTLVSALVPRVLGMQVYPNPARDRVTVLLPAGMERLQLFSPLGILLQEIAVDGRRQMVVDLSGMPRGICLLRAAGAGGVSVVKLQLGN